ncbi:hypothetical protein QTP88_009423 [Uroleucon formosanum]
MRMKFRILPVRGSPNLVGYLRQVQSKHISIELSSGWGFFLIRDRPQKHPNDYEFNEVECKWTNSLEFEGGKHFIAT